MLAQMEALSAILRELSVFMFNWLSHPHLRGTEVPPDMCRRPAPLLKAVLEPRYYSSNAHQLLLTSLTCRRSGVTQQPLPALYWLLLHPALPVALGCSQGSSSG